jgi:hypothetical protein
MRKPLFRGVAVASVVACVALFSSVPTEAATKKTVKRTTKKVVRPTTRVTTTAAPTTVAPTTAAPTTAAPTTAATTTVALAPVTFERNLYAVTVAGGGSVTLPLWINIPAGFRDSLTLRTRGEGAETRVRFDTNPARNYTVATINNLSGNGQLPLITIEAVGTADPTKVVASTVLSVFVSGLASPVVIPGAGGGVTYSVVNPTASAVRGGNALSIQIGITRPAGFTGTVEFSVAGGVPPGAGTSFTEFRTTANATTLFVSAGTSTAPGTYVIKVVAFSALGSLDLLIPITVA